MKTIENKENGKKRLLMSHKHILIITTVVFLLLIIALISSWFQKNSSRRDDKENVLNKSKIETSLFETITIALPEASKLYSNLLVTEIHSYDNDYLPNISAGEDGKREWWYVFFANEKGNFVRILIIGGEIEEIYNADEQGNNGLIDIADIVLTTELAVEKAKAVGLRGGDPDNADKEWVSGYNFKLEYGSLEEAPDESILFLDVIGISSNGNFTRISFDAKTGEILLAMEKIEHENGNIEWKSII